MNNLYQVLIRSSNHVSIEVQLMDKLFKVAFTGEELKTQELYFEGDLEILELKITLVGSIGSTAQVTILRDEDGFSWSEIIRILKEEKAFRIHRLKSGDFKMLTSDQLNFKPHKYFGNIDRDFKGGGIVPVPYEKSSNVLVFYATNRQSVGKHQDENFQDYNGVISNIKYGTCRVNIPHKRKLGELNRPEWWKLEFKERSDKHFMILSGSQLSGKQFFSAIADVLTNANDALVFIHGFNTSFKEAILRTAQICFDLGYSGVPITFSWPSKGGGILTYADDEQAIEDSCHSIIEFLKDLRLHSRAQRVSIIAHSMGNRGLTAALARLQEEHFFQHFVYNQVILAAPDIDAKIFLEDLAPKMKDCATRMTLYASSRDKALQASRSKNGSIIRLGESGDLITCSDGIDTVDASRTDPSILGHGYFASTSSLINDIYLLINRNSPPEERNLVTVETKKNKFWKFR